MATRHLLTSSARWPRTQLGCTVNYKDLKEEVSWQGFSTGEVDVVIENWGHPDLEKKYIDEQGVAVDLGSQGNKGVIGWYVPPWLAEEHPEVLDWQNLNDFASDFATAETGDQGQVLDGDPSYVTNDEALVKNLGLNFKVVYAGSEAALIQAFQKAEENKEFLIGYFYEPQWFLSEVPLVKVNLPPYKAGCDIAAVRRGLRLPALPAEQGGVDGVHGLRKPGGDVGQELQMDQRRPERGRQDDR